MRNLIILYSLLFVSCFGTKTEFLQEHSIQLSNPIIDSENAFFSDQAEIRIHSTDEQAIVQYKNSNDLAFQMYKNPIVVKESTKIQAKVTSQHFLDSEITEMNVIKLPRYKIKKIVSFRPPSPKYSDKGDDILIDQVKGTANFREKWLGYEGDTIMFSLSFDKSTVDKVVISCLQDQNAWIFGPSKIRVKYYDTILAETELVDVTDQQSNRNIFAEVALPSLERENLILEVIAPVEIPAWHPGAGNKPWLFIDEILIY